MRYRRMSVDQVKQFAAKYLVKNSRVVVYGVPGEPDFGKPVPTPDKNAPLPAMKADSVNVDEAWRANRPPSGAAPAMKIPTANTFKLANGLTVLLDERHNVPVVSTTVVFRSGTGANPVDKPGLASITLDMLDDGTTTRSATQFAEQIAQIGATTRTATTIDANAVTLNVIKSKYEAGLNLIADAVLNPTFPDAELERERQNRLGQLAQQRDDAGAIADKVLQLALFGANNPYGYTRLGTEQSIKAFKRDDLRTFWQENIMPNNAAVLVSGDITATELRTQLEKAFGNWKPGTPKQITKVAPAPTTAKLVLVDKPGAQQSQVRLGLAGPSRLTPDFTGLQVMNDLLGGAFSSRINLNLREEHGYTYGAFSTFTYLRDGGWFYVSSGVRTDVTAPSIREVAREMNRIVETNVTASELKMSKDGLAGALPARFETSDQTVGVLQNIYTFDLGLDYYSRYATQIPAITDKTVGDNAKKYLTPEKFVYVVVGDKAKIEEEIKKLNLGAIEYRDADGKVISK